MIEQKKGVLADMTVRMCCFSLGGARNYNKDVRMDKQSFMDNVIGNAEFQKDLKNGAIIGLLTHKGRDENAKVKGINQSDLAAVHPDACNVMRSCHIDNDSSELGSAYAGIDLLKGDSFPAAQKVKDMLKNNIWIGCSMSTISDYDAPSKTYYIKKLLGLDLTLKPYFLSSGIVSVNRNFSEDGDLGTSMKNELINFSTQDLVSFGNRIDLNDGIDYTKDMANFDIRSYLRETEKPLYQYLSFRIRELQRIIPTLDEDYLREKRDLIKSYVNDIIINYISQKMISGERINLNVELRLNTFLSRNPQVITTFNNRMNILNNIYKSNKYLNKNYTATLKTILNDLFIELWKTILAPGKVPLEIFYPSAEQTQVKNKVNALDQIMMQEVMRKESEGK